MYEKFNKNRTKMGEILSFFCYDFNLLMIRVYLLVDLASFEIADDFGIVVRFRNTRELGVGESVLRRDVSLVVNDIFNLLADAVVLCKFGFAVTKLPVARLPIFDVDDLLIVDNRDTDATLEVDTSNDGLPVAVDVIVFLTRFTVEFIVPSTAT